MGSQQGVFSRLVVTDPERPEAVTTVVEDTLLGFFWSPDGQKIAYFMPDLDSLEGAARGTSGLGVQAHVYDLASGGNRRLAIFEPTTAFFQVLPYFDQYHRSSTIWSPDSTHLVLSAVDEEGVPRIVVVEVASGTAQPIAEGELAFWSAK